jgi:predicted nucleotidyltransferase
MTTEIAVRVQDVLCSHPSIKAITLIGSRARGESTSLSDWDFSVETNDFDAAANILPELTKALDPLAQLWDPLCEVATYMLILPGPTKVDFLFLDQPGQHLPPPLVTAETLVSVDTHFWDWSLWLTSKLAAGKNELVEQELAKMTEHILHPMGITGRPTNLSEAVSAYLSARTRQEAKLGLKVPRTLGLEVERVVEAVSGPIA